MSRSREVWRSFAAVTSAVGATALTAAIVSGGLRTFWISAAIGLLVAFGFAVGRRRALRETSPPVADAARLLSGTSAASPASLEPSLADVTDGARHSQARIEALLQRQAELSRSAALLETVLGTMIEGVIVVDGAEQLVYANPAARRLLEIPEGTRLNRPLLEVVRSPGIETALKETLRTQRVHRSELDLRRKERAVTVTASPLAGSPGVVLVLHDVTELRRLERLRREFVSNVSHELKTPLTHIQAYADTLADGALDDPQHGRTFLARIIEQAERLQTLISDLLQLSRLESQQEPPELVAVSLSAAAARCVDEHQAAAAGKGLGLCLECRDEVAVLADPAGLQQILENLLDNALKYTPQGGQVAAAVYEADGYGVLEVADTGIGIPREEQARVFERFYRVDRARSRAVGGTGLGLAIVKHLVQQYQGRIELFSELGRGSRFVVHLRLAPVPLPAGGV